MDALVGAGRRAFLRRRRRMRSYGVIPTTGVFCVLAWSGLPETWLVLVGVQVLGHGYPPVRPFRNVLWGAERRSAAPFEVLHWAGGRYLIRGRGVLAAGRSNPEISD